MLIDDVKLALEISTTIYDDELSRLIESSVKDLNISGVDSDAITSSSVDPIVKQTIIVYVCYQFALAHGNIQRASAMKKAYNEMKSQLGMSTGYTTGGDFDVTTETD